MAEKNVFFIGLDDFNREKLSRIPQASECRFHAALSRADIKEVDIYDLDDLIERAARNIEAAGCGVDGIASFFDFPGSLLVPVLSERFGTPTTSFESLLKCEHKHWTRMEQQQAAPESTPHFWPFDPFQDGIYEEFDLIPPFWIKPVKSYRGFLSFHINDVQQFNEIIQIIREKIDYIVKPFLKLVQRSNAPKEIVDPSIMCLAESGMYGAQCTLEGYCYEDEVHVYGIVDSFRRINATSLSRYEYPTILPPHIQERMKVIAVKIMKHIGLKNFPFNMEMFYNQSEDSIMMLEINPRISLGHIDLFEKVHGYSHLSIMVDLALGREPRPLPREGQYRKGAHFLVRTPDPGTVHRVPSQEEIERVKARYPDTEVLLETEAGQHLTELRTQDSYSFEIAKIYLGAENETALLEKYDRVLSELPFDIEKDKEVIIR